MKTYDTAFNTNFPDILGVVHDLGKTRIKSKEKGRKRKERDNRESDNKKQFD